MDYISVVGELTVNYVLRKRALIILAPNPHIASLAVTHEGFIDASVSFSLSLSFLYKCLISLCLPSWRKITHGLVMRARRDDEGIEEYKRNSYR